MASRTITNRRSLVIVCIILFLTFLDNTIVSVVLSNIQAKLSAGVQDLQWIVDAYMLAFAVFMLFGGTLGDILGRKKVMLGGVGLFVIGSAIAMLANSVPLLVAGRVVMGLGAAASEPGTLSMIRHIYTNRSSRSRALGVWAAVSGMALAFGPVIGGVIIGFSDWRGVFGFSVIFGLMALIAGWIFLPENSNPRGMRLDWLGLFLGGASLCSAIFGLILGENSGYDQWWIILLFALSILTMAAFVRIELKSKDPVLPMVFFRNTRFSIANSVAFSANFAIFAVFFFVALYLQFIAGFSGYQIAIAFISMTISIVAASLIAGIWSAAHHLVPLTIAGCLIGAVGVFILDAVIQPNVSTATLAWSLAISGFGFGICLVTMTSSVLNIVPPERSGMAASTVNTFRELGGVFGVAVLGAIVNAQLTGQLVHKLKSLGMPTNFQSFVIYAITHGGHTPHNAHISIAALAAHASLVQTVTQSAYGAFGAGLNIALLIAGSLLAATGIVTAGIYIWQRHTNMGSLYLSHVES